MGTALSFIYLQQLPFPLWAPSPIPVVFLTCFESPSQQSPLLLLQRCFGGVAGSDSVPPRQRGALMPPRSHFKSWNRPGGASLKFLVWQIPRISNDHRCVFNHIIAGSMTDPLQSFQSVRKVEDGGTREDDRLKESVHTKRCCSYPLDRRN